jgi:hypothetical protein
MFAKGGKRTGSFRVCDAGKLPFVQAHKDVGFAPISVIEAKVSGARKRTPRSRAEQTPLSTQCEHSGRVSGFDHYRRLEELQISYPT